MTASGLLYLALVPACALAGLVGFGGWLWPEVRPLRAVAAGAAWVVALATLAAWLLRWSAAGHLPLFGTYESALSLAVAVLGSALAVDSVARGRPRVFAPAALVAAALLLHGLGYDDSAFALTISERSWVVDVHALFAWAAFGALTVNAGLGLRLLVGRTPRPQEARLLSASLSAGFLLHTGMMISGSVYKLLLFGKAWSFDPIEILGFVAWMAYATLLHMHLFARWEGRRLAAWCLGLFVLLVVTYRGIVYFPGWSTYHIFDLDLRMHLG